MRVLVAAIPLEAGYLLLRRLDNLQQFAVETIGIWLATSLFYLVACWWTEKKGRPPMAAVVGAGLVFRLTVSALYPSLSEDPYRYRWEGKLQAAGGNPYRERPADAQWAALRDRTFGLVNRKDIPAGYGPVLEGVFALTYALVARFEPDEFRQVLWFKAPFALFDLATAALLAWWRPQSLLIYFWSPVVVIEIWASGHNDSVLVFFLVAAVAAGCSGRWGWAYGALWMAALAKFWPALLFPLFWRSGGRARLALAWTPLAAIAAWPYLDGIRELPRVLTGLLAGWSNNASLFHAVYAAAERDFEPARPAAGLLVLAAAIVVAWRRPPLLQGVLWTTALLLFLSANCFPWYLTWLVPLLAVDRNAALLLWTALVALAYHILIPYRTLGLWQEDPFYLWLEYVPVYGMLLALPWLRRLGASRDLRPKSANG